MNKKRRFSVLTITMILIWAIAYHNITDRVAAADNTFKDASGEYIITDDTQMEVQFTGLSKKSATSVEIPSTIKINEQEYKVTGVKANALNGNKKVKKLIIGENVKVIGKKAFYGCKNLKNVTINTFNLKAKTVGTAAFKGLNAKVVVLVPENKLKAYKKILKSKGLTGKKQAVKGRKIETEEKDDEKLDPNRNIPAPSTMFTIDNYFGLMSNIREEDGYSIGDSIPITAGFQMSYLMYGHVTTRTTNSGFWIRCDYCGQMFDNQDDYNIIGAFLANGCTGSGSFVFGQDYSGPFTASHWIPDDRACSATFHITLPVGLSYKEGSLKMFQMTKHEVSDSAYNVNVNGQDITVTIPNIKDASIHDGIAEKISITMDTELNSNVAAINTVTASMSYDNGTGAKTVDMGSANIYAATMKFRNTDMDGNDISGAKFALYKYKTLESGSVYYEKYVKVLDNITGNPCTIAGLNSGKYKLVQTAAPAGYKKMDNYEFNVNFSGHDGKIDSLSVDDSNKFVWDVDLETGTISTNIVNN